jgi:hypothetical protein
MVPSLISRLVTRAPTATAFPASEKKSATKAIAVEGRIDYLRIWGCVPTTCARDGGVVSV